jgi:uncharacterized membrane protein
MSERISSELISRRGTFSLGMAAALSLAATVITATGAVAQTRGMERRDDRRGDRQDRRSNKTEAETKEEAEKKAKEEAEKKAEAEKTEKK